MPSFTGQDATRRCGLCNTPQRAAEWATIANRALKHGATERQAVAAANAAIHSKIKRRAVRRGKRHQAPTQLELF